LNGEGAAAPRYALYYAPRLETGWPSRRANGSAAIRDRPDAGAAAGAGHSDGSVGRDHGRAAALRLPRHLEGADRAGGRRHERDFLDAVGRFAAGDRAFAIPALELAEISGFLALVPAARCTELQDLADRCVVEFDESPACKRG